MESIQSAWTYKQFNWALKDRVNLDLIRKDDFVTQMWSDEYFTSLKGAVGLAKESARQIVACKGGLGERAKHLVNLAIILVLIGVNIELGNFIKGVAGALIALGKMAVWHPGAMLVHAVAALIFCCNKEKRTEHLEKLKENAVGFVKDIVSLITCVGHAIPSWLPLVLLYVIPPIGIAFTVVKVLAEYTGIFDVLAYGGTAIMLYAKYKFALGDTTDEAKKTVAAWHKLKEELNPGTSFEGATLAMYACHVLVEGVSAVVGVFFPGAGAAIKWSAWGLQGVVGAGLYGNIGLQAYRERQLTKADPMESILNGTAQPLDYKGYVWPVEKTAGLL